MARSQIRSAMAINTPLGEDVMLLRELKGHEGVSELFSYDLVMDSTDHAVDHEKILGLNVTARLELPEEGTRFWNGFIRSFAQTGVSNDGLAVYKATMVPALWFLTRTADCRIFQNKSVPDIIEEILSDFGISDYSLRLTESYPALDYCVQYRETAFNFISRLMEELGIFYYFAHENGKHDLIIADARGRLEAWPNYEEIRFLGPGRSSAPGESISAWTLESRIVTDAVAQNDYNFETPATSLLTKASAGSQNGRPVYEVYDYPGRYPNVETGDRLSRIRHETNQWQHRIYHGIATARGIVPGYIIKVKDHPQTEDSTEFLVIDADVEVKPEAGDSLHHYEEQYACFFTAIEANTPFRPPRKAEKPVVEGPQTAIVVGPAGEEIYCDEYGRVKVQFHWDRDGKADENSSCWVRVSQSWAGKKWGAMFLPRIGHEVVVEFLEGDPDRPLVTGRVYHATNMPPYDLPAEKTKSTVKSNTSKGGGGFNEIRFEDKADNEQIFIHGQKDLDVRIENDAREWIGHDRHLVVGNDQFEIVEANKHRKIIADRKTEIGGNDSTTVQGNRMESVVQQKNLQVGGDLIEEITGNHEARVLGSRIEKVDGSQSLTIGNNLDEKVGIDHALEAGMNMHLKGGMNVVVEAGMTLTLKVGGSFIVLDPTGVSISGPLLKLNSGGSAGSGSGASPASPGQPMAPELPDHARDADSDSAGQIASATDHSQQRSRQQVGPSVTVTPAAGVLQDAAQSGRPFCEECERARQQQQQQQQQQE